MAPKTTRNGFLGLRTATYLCHNADFRSIGSAKPLEIRLPSARLHGMRKRLFRGAFAILLGSTAWCVMSMAAFCAPNAPGLGIGYERYLEDSLDKALDQVLGQMPHIVQVKALLSESQPQVQQALPPMQSMAQPISQPTMAPDTLAFEENNEPPFLPGLLSENSSEKPRTLQPPPQVQQPIQYQPQYQPLTSNTESPSIDKLTVMVILPSVLPNKDDDFVRSLVLQKVDHRLVRDVEVNIMRRDFPNAENLPMLGDRPQGIPGWVWALIAGGVFLGLGVLLFKKRPSQVQSQAPMMPMSQSLAIPTSAPASEAPKQDPLHELTLLILSEPEVAHRYASQIAKEEQGIDRLAILTKALGMSVSRKLFPGLPEDLWRSLEIKQLETTPTDEEFQSVVQDTVRTLLRERSRAARPTYQKKTPFAFLETLDDSQLLYILQEENSKIQALALSQLPPERSARIMQLFDPSDMGTLISAMGNLQSIPLPMFEGIAMHLAEKAAEAPSFSTSVTNGLDYLVHILERSDQVMEKRILQELTTQNPQLLQQVRQNYLAFEDIPKVPRQILRDALRDFPKEPLAELLREAPVEISTPIIDALNERGRMIVEDALDGPPLLNFEQAALEEVRQQLLAKIRQQGKIATLSRTVPQGGA